MTTKKKIKDYISKSMRKLKHRKGFGVHSPFAFRIITEVIEEKIPYYAYHSMQKVYHRQAPIPFKVAALLFRLSNRFHCRRILEVGCDGGYSLLPLALVDSRNELTTVASAEREAQTRQHLSFFPSALGRIGFVSSVDEVAPDYVADLLVINALPDDMTAEAFLSWLKPHLHAESVMFVHGIQIGHRLEELWDGICDSDDIDVTMDLYDFGLAIRRPHFYKQHYVVSF